jgi:DNA-binding response OmpR family regulator
VPEGAEEVANILIVDDDAELREILTDFFTAEGHRVSAAEDGEDGFRRLSESRPDAIVLDIEMPKLDGPGMAGRMLVHDAGLERIPILLFSGGAELSRVAREVGTRYYLPKPSSPERIRGTLDQLLSERAPLEPHEPAVGA